MNTDGYALVTGAASGIGLACAQMYAEEGAAGVAFADINFEAAEKAAKESLSVARHPDYRAIPIYVDTANDADVRQMVHKVSGEFGRIDYAVNCAGIAVKNPQDFAEQTYADFDHVMATNLKGVFHCVQAEINAMKDQEPRRVSIRDPDRGMTRGTIVNIGSVASYNAFRGASSYVTSKHAVLGLTKNAALDTAHHNIRINCVCPNFVDTPLVQRAFEGNPERLEHLKTTLVLGRLAQPSEIADVAVFLSSPRSSNVTGAGWIVGASGTI